MIASDVYIHETACVDDGAHIGSGTMIWHFSHIFSGARIGKACKLGQNVVVHGTAVLGDNVKAQNNVSIYDGVILEDDVFCGPSCVFTNIMTPRAAIPRNSPEHYRKTLVRKGATIGANATIVCGVTVGRYAFIGAGSVVTRDVPDYALVYGNPSRQHGWVCYCGEKLCVKADAAECGACGRKYILKESALKER